MKKLSIKQKAKRYDEAIRRARDSFNYPDYPGFIRADVVFPELKESEDERIRKELILFFTERAKYTEDSTFNGLSSKEITTWLEKQGKKEPNKMPIWKHWKDGIAGNGDGKLIYLIKYGNTYSLSSCLSFECDYILLSDLDKCEQKPFDYENATIVQKDFAPKAEPKFKVGDIIIKSQNSDINKFGKFKITGIKDGRYWYNEFVICEISEQDEWELARIEPKFKVGDWIFIEEVDGYKQGPFQIKEITQYSYTFDKRGVMPFECESLMTPWTIQDAKNGDVLANGTIVLIVDHLGTFENRPIIYSWYFADSKKFYGIGTSEPDRWEVKGFTPATKEQRDLLFSEMKENGYKLDSEKKKLL